MGAAVVGAGSLGAFERGAGAGLVAGGGGGFAGGATVGGAVGAGVGGTTFGGGDSSCEAPHATMHPATAIKAPFCTRERIRDKKPSDK